MTMIRPLLAVLGLAVAAACVSPAVPQTEPSMPEAPSLTLDRLYASPGLSGPSPRAVKYSPDGSRVTFLKAREDDGSRFDLWQFDVATGAQSLLVDSTLLEPDEVELSEEEKAAFTDLNERYMGRHGFPFIIAVRDHNKDSILKAMQRRMEAPKDREFEEACRQVERIAELRLKAMDL